MQHHPIVDIVKDRVRPLGKDQYDSLAWDYDPNHSNIITRTSEYWKVFAGNTHDDLKGGPLVHPHRLYEIHGHWGQKFPAFCREHAVDGQQAYAGELHLVHTNIERSVHPIKAAIDKDPRFRTVISIFLKEGRRPHKELTKITDDLPEACKAKVVVGGKNLYGMREDVDPSALFPESLEYWTYDETRGAVDDESWVKVGEGQFDTEDRREKVTYIVFKTPIEVSKEQLLILFPPYMREGEREVGDVPLSTRSPIREGVARRPRRRRNTLSNKIQTFLGKLKP